MLKREIQIAQSHKVREYGEKGCQTEERVNEHDIHVTQFNLIATLHEEIANLRKILLAKSAEMSAVELNGERKCNELRRDNERLARENQMRAETEKDLRNAVRELNLRLWKLSRDKDASMNSSMSESALMLQQQQQHNHHNKTINDTSESMYLENAELRTSLRDMKQLNYQLERQKKALEHQVSHLEQRLVDTTTTQHQQHHQMQQQHDSEKRHDEEASQRERFIDHIAHQISASPPAHQHRDSRMMYSDTLRKYQISKDYENFISERLKTPKKTELISTPASHNALSPRYLFELTHDAAEHETRAQDDHNELHHGECRTCSTLSYSRLLSSHRTMSKHQDGFPCVCFHSFSQEEIETVLNEFCDAHRNVSINPETTIENIVFHSLDPTSRTYGLIVFYRRDGIPAEEVAKKYLTVKLNVVKNTIYQKILGEGYRPLVIADFF